MKIYLGTINYVFAALSIIAIVAIGIGFGVMIDGIIAHCKNYVEVFAVLIAFHVIEFFGYVVMRSILSALIEEKTGE